MNGDADGRRAQAEEALRLARAGVVGALFESVVVALFAFSMAQATGWALAFVALRLGSSLLFWLFVRRGWTLGARDPSLVLARFAAEWALQLAFTVLMPRLTVVFMIALLVSYNQAMIHFNRRQFTLAWLLLGAALTGALCEVHATFAHPGTRGIDLFLLWLFFVLCLARLTTVGRVHCGLREELSVRSDSLQASAERLRALSDKERLEERERVARELHDTLLQELRALRSRFEAAAAGIPRGHAAHAQVESALRQADGIIEESQARVLDLGTGRIPPAGLPQALSDLGASLAAEHPATFALHISGSPRLLREAVADEVYCIAREAMLNAFRHAGATRIDLDLRYEADGLGLQLRDNGKGIEPRVASQGREGHWGLGIMRERARRLGGRLDLASAPNAGTRLRLRLPAALAFVDGAASLRPGAFAGLAARLRTAAARWVLEGSINAPAETTRLSASGSRQV
jgi:signal transduction histidine kinase